MSGVNTASMIAASKVIPAKIPKPRVNALVSLPANSPRRQSRYITSDGDRKEPHSQHQSHHSCRGQFSYCAEADGAQTKLADRLQEVDQHEPHRTHASAPGQGSGECDHDESNAGEK